MLSAGARVAPFLSHMVSLVTAVGKKGGESGGRGAAAAAGRGAFGAGRRMKAAAAGAAFAAGVLLGRGCWLVPEPEPEPEPAPRCEPPPPADPGQEAQSLLQKISELQATNRQLAQGHQRLAAIPPPLEVPPPPPAPPQLPAPPASVVRLTQELERRRAGGARRRKKRREPLTIDSAYDVGGEGGRPEQVKEEMNAAVCEALRRCGDDLEAWIAEDTRHLLLLIDSPALLSTAALLKQWPGLANSQQIVVPQYDLSHYVQMITSDFDGGYVGVRLQRLDQWLCTNAQRGFRCRLFLADVESAFLGHQVTLPTAPGVSNEGPSSRLLVLLPAKNEKKRGRNGRDTA